jgi:hypothetical protein
MNYKTLIPLGAAVAVFVGLSLLVAKCEMEEGVKPCLTYQIQDIRDYRLETTYYDNDCDGDVDRREFRWHTISDGESR